MSDAAQRIVQVLEDWIQNWSSVVARIEQGLVRYREDRGQGPVDITDETKADYLQKIANAETLIAKIKSES